MHKEGEVAYGYGGKCFGRQIAVKHTEPFFIWFGGRLELFWEAAFGDGGKCFGRQIIVKRTELFFIWFGEGLFFLCKM